MPTSEGRRGPQGRRKRRRSETPDILYHASNTDRLALYRAQGFLDAGAGGQVFLSDSESDAWRIAHRFSAEPVVLYIDAGRARRAGVRFHRTRRGLYVARHIPVRHVLNLRDGFREQVSSGGFLVRRDRGQVEIALVACTRRSGTTWEIAKGKLEVGETPEQACCRELQEEMGFEGQLSVELNLGIVRYGFHTPDGMPRLKSLHVYVVGADVAPEEFSPASGEGICEVRWFSPAEVYKRVTHSSLRPVVVRLLDLLGDGDEAGGDERDDDDEHLDDDEPQHQDDDGEGERRHSA